jgi:hypothetical protein
MPDGNGTARRRALGRKTPQRSKGNGRLEVRREAVVTPSRATDIRTHQSINPKLQRNGGTKA